MSEIVDVLKIMGLVVGLITPFIIVFLAVRTIQQAVDRAQRELAVKIIYDWGNDTNWISSRSIDIAKELDSNIVDGIIKKKPVTIPNAHHGAITAILRNTFADHDLPDQPSNSSGSFTITQQHSEFIRSQWVGWLNRLEGVLAAWQQGAADVELMKAEFRPLVGGSEAELEVLKDLCEGRLPVITAFYKHIKEGTEIPIRPPIHIWPWR